MSYLVQKNGALTVLHPCWNAAGSGTVTGKAGSFTYLLRDESGNTASTGLTITEQGSSGYYDFDFPGGLLDADGVWELQITNPSGTDQTTYYYYIQVVPPGEFSRVRSVVASGNPRITWTPSDATNAQSMDFPHGLYLFDGGPMNDAELSFTQGGKLSAVVHDVTREYTAELRAFSEVNSPAFYARLNAFWSHVSRGGTFAFAVDSGKTWDTTISQTGTEGATSLLVNSVSGIGAGDFLFLEDATDPTLFEVVEVSSVGTNSVNLSDSLTRPYGTGSVARYDEYFPTCAMLERRAAFPLRRAARGANRRDLKFKFRTVR
jgi:hypothetical protein